MLIMLRLTLFLGLLAAVTPTMASPFLVLPEPREGLLQDPKEFASVTDPSSTSVGPRSYAQHLQTLQQHYLVVEGKHPPIYYFFCTVYYTPKESGFTKARGFDVTPATRSRLGGRKFPNSFIKTVIVEGFGRIKEPTSSGKNYIKYSGTWGYGSTPLGNRGNSLIDRKSAAVHRYNSLFKKGMPMKVLDPYLYNCFGGTDFETADTGGGLFRSQIDLYWGEDVPLSPLEPYRPISCPVAVRWIVPVIVGK